MEPDALSQLSIVDSSRMTAMGAARMRSVNPLKHRQQSLHSATFVGPRISKGR